MPRLEEGAKPLAPDRLAALLPVEDRMTADRPPIPRQREAVDPQASEEELIVDDRSGIRPAQLVEDKLTRILKDSSIPVSHLQMRRLLRSR
jgi:hypothetical protein